MPSTPSQKSIDVWRSAPTIVMWWTPWLWSFRIRRFLAGCGPCRSARLVHDLRELAARVRSRVEAPARRAPHRAQPLEAGRNLGHLRQALGHLVAALGAAPEGDGERERHAKARRHRGARLDQWRHARSA